MGFALAEWMYDGGASPVQGKIVIPDAQHSVDAPLGPGTQAWVTTSNPAAIQYLTFATPVEAADPSARCGRVDFADWHLTVDAGTSTPSVPFPAGCTSASNLSPQEKLWEFLFLDAPMCVQPGLGP
jgi:hypothetical protein